MHRTRERGSALLVVVVVIFVIVALTAAYVGQTVSVARGTSSSEARLEARTTAWSGLNRAILELDDSCSASAVCSHVVAGAPNPCFGNIDGAIDAPSVFDLATNPKGVKQRNLAADQDLFSIDAGTTGADGWIDFRDETVAAPGVALSHRVAGALYSVRTKAEGALVTTEGDPPFYAAYRIRAYGTARGEVAGLEALVLRQTTRPFQFAAFGDAGVTGNGSIFTDSWNSSTTARYADAPVKGVQGDLGSNNDVNLAGASATLNGLVTTNANQPVPDADVPPAPSTVYVAGDVRTTQSFAQPQLVIGSLALAGSDVVTFAPPPGGTMDVWITQGVSVTGQAQIVIQQPPAPSATGAVRFFLTGPGPYKFSGGGIANDDPRAVPLDLQIEAANDVSIAISGGADLTGVIYAPRASVDLSGTAQLMGGVVGATVTLNSGSFHFDEALPKVVFRTRPIYRIATLVDVAAR
jgi:hypothetical protein